MAVRRCHRTRLFGGRRKGFAGWRSADCWLHRTTAWLNLRHSESATAKITFIGDVKVQSCIALAWQLCVEDADVLRRPRICQAYGDISCRDYGKNKTWYACLRPIQPMTGLTGIPTWRDRRLSWSIQDGLKT